LRGLRRGPKGVRRYIIEQKRGRERGQITIKKEKGTMVPSAEYHRKKASRLHV